jgi:hypothetical protein
VAITFEYDGQTFDFVERPTTGELRAIMRWLGDGATEAESLIGTVAISIKRGRPAFHIADVDAIDGDVVMSILQQVVAQQQAADAASTAAASATDGAAPAGEDDPYAGVPDADVPPTSGGSEQTAQPPNGQLAAVVL